MSFTAEQIQNFRKIMHEKFRQNDFCGGLFDQVMSKTGEVWKDTEIVAFLQAKNIQPSEMDSFILTFLMKSLGEMNLKKKKT